MAYIRDVIHAFQNAGIRDKVKIMIGGAPVTEAFRKNIGADIYTTDATTAAETALSLINEMNGGIVS